MRKIVKVAMESTVVRSGIARVWRGMRSEEALILAYHNIVPPEDLPFGDSSLHLPLDEFRAQLDMLDEHFRVLPLHELLSGTHASAKRRVAITFDDAYGGAIQLGIPEVLERGLTATVFVPPGLLGEAGFWWDLLADEENGGLKEEARCQALWDLAGRQCRVLDWAADSIPVMPSLTPIYRPATEDDIMRLAGEPGLYWGSHTWSHVNLAAVPFAEAFEEMRLSFEWLKALPSFQTMLSYPYGCWKDELQPFARELGYEFGLLIQGRGSVLVASERHPFSIPRMNIPRGLSKDGFLARISGVWPV